MNNHGVSWRTKVRFGHHAQDDSPASPNLVEANILEINFHPDYDASAQENDLCLLKIEQVTLSEDVDVVCLPAQGAHVAADDNNVNSNNHCLAAGWGFENESGSRVNELKSVQVKIYSDLWCISQAAIQTTAFFAKDVEFCAGWLGTGGRDTCTFDSGGPLVCIENGEPVQYGITSWGSGCGEALNPGIYAEVAEFIRKGPFN
jgi:secreted trypsin-like serine protease